MTSRFGRGTIHFLIVVELNYNCRWTPSPFGLSLRSSLCRSAPFIPDCNAVGGVVCDVIFLSPWERNLSFCKAPLMTESGGGLASEGLENERWSVRVKAFGSRDPGD